MTTLHPAESMNRSPVQRGLFLISLALACIVLAPEVRAQGCNQGCGDSNTTFLGIGALQFNAGGALDTAIGWEALYSNTTGQLNTANGGYALQANTTGSLNTATGADALASNRDFQPLRPRAFAHHNNVIRLLSCH